MPMPTCIALSRYAIVRDEVKTQRPDAWRQVIDACRRVPEQFSRDDVWLVGRAKPCWTNVLESRGRRIAEDLNRHPAFDSAQTIASPDWEIGMLSNHLDWKCNENFALRGAEVRAFVDSLDLGGLRSYLWRLHGIRRLALGITLDERVRTLVDQLVDRQHAVLPVQVVSWTREFSAALGAGWGQTTSNHLLADLGLSVQPNVNLVRSAVRMGLLEPDVPATLSESQLARFRHRLAPAIVHHLLAMAEQVVPSHGGSRASARCEVGKVLMEWSREGLARPLWRR